jgi:phage terminase small subunit
MPRPRKPTALKVLAGTLRRDRDAGLQMMPACVVCAPPAPDWLPNAYAVTEWERLAPILAANGLLFEGSLSALAVLCALHGRLATLWAAGEAPTAALIAGYRALASDFGLTPIAAGKVRPATPQRINPFAANRRQ